MKEEVGRDVLGQALSRYHATPSEQLLTTLEFDTGEAWEQPVSAYFAGRDEWGVLETWLFGEIRGRLLDIGCGAGRLSAEAASLPGASQTLGIDSSPGAVGVAIDRGLDAVVATFPDGLASPAVGEGTWETVALFGNNLGLLQQCRSAGAGLDALARALVPTGRLLLTAGKPDVLPSAVRTAGEKRWGHPGAFRARLRHGTAVSYWFDYAFFDPRPTIELLARSGWSCDEVRETTAQWAAVVRPPA